MAVGGQRQVEGVCRLPVKVKSVEVLGREGGVRVAAGARVTGAVRVWLDESRLTGEEWPVSDTEKGSRRGAAGRAGAREAPGPSGRARRR